MKRSQFLALAGTVPTVFAANRESDTLQIDIFDVIGMDFFGEGITAKSIARKLDANSGVKQINVRVNSPGGDVFESQAIFNLLREHDAHVTVDVIGLAASGASVVALAGDTVRMADNAMMMIHDPWMLAIGDHRDMTAAAEVLGKVRETMLNLYQANSSLGRAELSSMMLAETWMTAGDAKAGGFIDEIVSASRATPDAQASMDAASRIFAQLSRYSHTPKTLLDKVGSTDGHLLVAAMAGPFDPENDTMDKKLLAALGLSETATVEEAIAAAKVLAAKANEERTPSLEQWVPRADYTAAVARAEVAEGAVAQRDEADRDRAVAAAVDAATEAGKITPGQREQALKMCKDSGVETFQAFVGAATAQVEPTNLDGRDPANAGGTGPHGLTEEQVKIAHSVGVKPELYARLVKGEIDSAQLADEIRRESN